jgi:predicted nuclease of restriction endonuclease-like RecB superfamily
MLTVDVVKVSRKKGQLQVVPHGGLLPRRAADLLTEILAVCHEHHGLTRGALLDALTDVVSDPKEEQALRAAKKLVLDQLEFAPRDDVDPTALRQQLFMRAAAARHAGTDWHRDAIVAAVAADNQLSTADIENGLYADLEDAHVVDAAALPSDGAVLLPDWIERELQAVLLRASEVTVVVEATAADVRRLLRALKLQQRARRVRCGW